MLTWEQCENAKFFFNLRMIILDARTMARQLNFLNYRLLNNPAG